jgi:hydroxyethylthiazole kinase
MSGSVRTPKNLISYTQSAVEEVRYQTPLVQCITNNVVINFTANALLSVGAAAAMVDIPTDSGPLGRWPVRLQVARQRRHAHIRAG